MMTPLGLFLRSLSRWSAVFLGAGLVFANPSRPWSASRTATAQKSPAHAASDALTAALADADADVRRQAAGALGRLRSTTAVPALAGALRDPSRQVRIEALFALAAIRDPRALGAVAASLRDPDAMVRAHAACALRALRTPSR